MAYIRTEEVREIRNALKDRFGKEGFRFSVRLDDGNLGVSVSIMKGPRDFSDIGNATDINRFHIEKFYPTHVDFLNEVLEIIKTGSSKKWYDKSDAQTDSFNTAFYIDLGIGKWDKPYQKV